MKTKEQTFEEIMSTQQKYHWLGHQTPKTPEERKKQFENIQKRVDKITHKLVIYFVMGMMISSLFSCNKDFNDDPTRTEQREMITQTIKLTDIHKSKMSKGFDPSTWVYNYNNGSYILTFENVNNPTETITRSVSINELINGISLSMYKGTYNISYQTTHSNTTTLDIKIDMTDVSVNSTPLNLSGNYDDFLIVLSDVPIEECYIVGGGGTTIETFNILDDIRYIYYDKTTDPTQGDLRIRYFKTGASQYQYYDMYTFLFGNIYWFTSPIGIGTTINFPEWIVTKIVL